MTPNPFQSAIQLHQAGKLAEAEAAYRQLLARKPNDPEAINALGVLLMQKGEVDQGIEAFRRAVALNAAASAYHRNLGLAYMQAKLVEPAIACFRQAVILEPRDAVTFDRLSALLYTARRHAEAIEAAETAVKLRPSVPAFRATLASAYMRGGRPDLAITQFQEAARLAPGEMRYWLDLGAALAEGGFLNEALDAFDRCISMNSSLAALHSNRSAVLRELGRFDESKAAIERAVAIDPDFIGVQNNLGNMHFDDGNLEEARIAWEKAVKVDPGFAGARWNYARVLLALGYFEQGWDEFECRFHITGMKLKRPFSQPQWDGADPAGKTVLLFTEGGFGDALNFIRLVPLVTGRNAKWLLECQPELIRLFQSLPGVPEMIPRGQPLPHFDLQIPLQSLPRILKLRLETIPNRVPYLHAPQDAVKRWAKRLASETKLRVGLAWAGSPGAKGDVRPRSINRYAPMADIPGVKFFSLQKGPEGQQAPPAGMDFANFTAEFNDFADTAAFVQNLDLVISVDTSTVHLAGALGRPVWVHVPFTADFRWLHKRTDSPWYPTMRLFRDPRRGDDQTPFLQMAEALRELAAQRKS